MKSTFFFEKKRWKTNLSNEVNSFLKKMIDKNFIIKLDLKFCKKIKEINRNKIMTISIQVELKLRANTVKTPKLVKLFTWTKLLLLPTSQCDLKKVWKLIWIKNNLNFILLSSVNFLFNFWMIHDETCPSDLNQSN